MVIEILSPSDRFGLLNQKCRRYSAWGAADILVFDPVEERVWGWDRQQETLVPARGTYRFHSKPGGELAITEVFRRLRQKMGNE